MRMGTRRVWRSTLLVSLFVLVAGSMSSYIDGNSGSYIIQLVVGAFAGAVMTVGVFWRRIRAAVARRLTRKA